jgi:hypothetical protein
MRAVSRSLALGVALSLLAVGLLAGSTSQAQSAKLKSLMGDNFQNVQVILYNLVTARYNLLPAQIRPIHDHALELTKTVPPDLKTDVAKRTFTTYAYQLEYNTSNMLTVLNELVQHDKTPVEPGKQNIDYLRVVAARQFGEIVSTCVLCHNQFRRHPVQ